MYSSSQESLANGLKGVQEETKKFTTKLAEQGIEINENLASVTKKLYDSALDFTKDLSEKVDAAVAKKD